MKKTAIDVQLGKDTSGKAWELKNVQFEIPETLQEWIGWMDEARVVRTLETYHIIRCQDAARRAHNGGKNTRGLTDEQIRTEVVPNFRLFERTRISAAPRALTPEELRAQELAHLKTLDKAARLARLAEMQAEIEAMDQATEQD